MTKKQRKAAREAAAAHNDALAGKVGIPGTQAVKVLAAIVDAAAKPGKVELPKVAGLPMVEQVKTKTGTKRHRKSCRFAKTNPLPCVDNPLDRKLIPCAVCKPHLEASKLPEAKDTTLAPCGVCLKGHKEGKLTKEAAVTAGHVTTKTGVKYHKAGCKHSRTASTATKADAKATPAPKATKGTPRKAQAQAVAF